MLTCLDRVCVLRVCVCVCVLRVWVLTSVLGYWVLLLFLTTHHCSQQPITTSLPFNCFYLRHSVCVVMVIIEAPPTPCLLQCEDEADLWLMMQASCRRHHFPREESLFLPVGTKYTKLPDIFMEPHLIAAPPGKHLPQHSASFSPFIPPKRCSFQSIFLFPELRWLHFWRSWKYVFVSALYLYYVFNTKGRFHTDIHPQWGGQRSVATQRVSAVDFLDIYWG